MKNVTATVSDDQILTITVDLKQRHGPSASGKTIQIASSLGNVSVPGNSAIKFGINVYTYAPKK